MADIFAMVDTWNNAGTTFTAIQMNVTDTASNAASLLMDLQIAGSSKFKVNKSGQINVDPGAKSTPGITFGDADSGFYFRNSNKDFALARDGVNTFQVDGAALVLHANHQLAWSSGQPDTNGGDISLFRDAANTLAMRRTTNAQVFRVYNTTDAGAGVDPTNYERGVLRWNSNVFEVGVEAGGTGTIRTMLLKRLASSTGAGTPSLGSNCPASTLTAPYTWIQVQSSDGSTVYMPAWK